MSSRRTLILLGAIAVGVVAALLLFNYVRGIEDRANNNAKRVDVFAAKAPIKRGVLGKTAVEDGSIGTSKIPQEFKPSTAIASTDEIIKKVALFDIPAGAVIIQGMFVDPAAAQVTFRARLKNPDHVAITVSVDQVRGVGGFLQPGDEVNILVFQDIDTEGAKVTAASPGELPATYVLDSIARYLYQKVQILAVGQNALQTPGEQASTTGTQASAAQAGNTGLITFNVPPQAAQLIAMAQQAGSIYLTLVAEDYQPRPLPPPPPIGSTLPGEDPAQLTPYGPAGNEE
ncbi:Flp pilus assembly protein CpaB [Rhabdothermincola sp.]|uniref:Flp pilus assembly protein CpaB n=1 Tax=Rhabdothermincola sp. TaxID=2820405 RepID=UPI002FE2368D